MASITATLATLAVTVTLGYSVDHRPIRITHVPGPGPRVLVVGCIHGNECAGMAVIRALAHVRTPHEDLWLIPTLNPDGLARGTRQNADGVDLNRNFAADWKPFGPPWSVYAAGPHPFSEREAQIARNLVERLHPAYTIWFHQHMDLIWAWGRSSQAGRRYATLAHMRYRHWRWLAGTASNWENGLPGGEISFTVELPAGSLDGAAVARQVRAVLGVSGGG
jgi:murein peptide amidase A